MSEEDYPSETVAILNEGNSVIVVDDSCYCVRNRKEDGTWGWSAWVFREAVAAMRELPENPREAPYIN